MCWMLAWKGLNDGRGFPLCWRPTTSTVCTEPPAPSSKFPCSGFPPAVGKEVQKLTCQIQQDADQPLPADSRGDNGLCFFLLPPPHPLHTIRIHSYTHTQTDPEFWHPKWANTSCQLPALQYIWVPQWHFFGVDFYMYLSSSIVCDVWVTPVPCS